MTADPLSPFLPSSPPQHVTTPACWADYALKTTITAPAWVIMQGTVLYQCSTLRSIVTMENKPEQIRTYPVQIEHIVFCSPVSEEHRFVKKKKNVVFLRLVNYPPGYLVFRDL